MLTRAPRELDISDFDTEEFVGETDHFGLVTNAAGDMRDPRKMLPRALYTSVILVIAIYLAVALTVTGNLSNEQIERAEQ